MQSHDSKHIAECLPELSRKPSEGFAAVRARVAVRPDDRNRSRLRGGDDEGCRGRDMNRDELIEIARTAIYVEMLREGPDREGVSTCAKRYLEAALSVIEAAGLVVVPREPTRDMLIMGGSDGNCSTREVWEAMIAESPLSEGGKE